MCVCASAAVLGATTIRYSAVLRSTPVPASKHSQSVILQAASETTENIEPVDRFQRAECATAYGAR